MKKLMPGELRFIAKVWDKKLWGVYDRVVGSWPGQRDDLGVVGQELESEAAAQSEADRCNSIVSKQKVGAPPKEKSSSKRKVNTREAVPEHLLETVEVDTPPVLEVLEEVVGYDMTEEELAAQEAALKEAAFK